MSFHVRDFPSRENQWVIACKWWARQKALNR
jgi:hypothetical protein